MSTDFQSIAKLLTELNEASRLVERNKELEQQAANNEDYAKRYADLNAKVAQLQTQLDEATKQADELRTQNKRYADKLEQVKERVQRLIDTVGK